MCFIYLFTDTIFMQLFENFSCSFEPDGHGYLNKYPWIQCSIYDIQYFLGLFLPSILFTTLYTVGFPFIIFVLLFKNRKDLHSKKMKIKYGFLFDNYKDHLWWMEIAFILRRILIIATVSFWHNSANQEFILTLILFAYFIFFSAFTSVFLW